MIEARTLRLASQIVLVRNEPRGITALDGRIRTMVSCNESVARPCAKPQQRTAYGALTRCLAWVYDIRESAAACGIVRFSKRPGE